MEFLEKILAEHLSMILNRKVLQFIGMMAVNIHKLGVNCIELYSTRFSSVFAVFVPLYSLILVQTRINITL